MSKQLGTFAATGILETYTPGLIHQSLPVLPGESGPVRDEAGSGDFGLGHEALQGHRKAIKGGAER